MIKRNTGLHYRKPRSSHTRRGAASFDNILVLGVILALAVIVIPLSLRMVQLVYEMIAILIMWPYN